MNAVAHNRDISYQPLWFAFASVEKQDKAPYATDTQVTPESVYGDDDWFFPSSWLTPGNLSRNKLRFANWSSKGNVDQLVRGLDDQLIEQLKQYAYCLIFHRHKLLGKRKTINARPRTLDTEFLQMRQFFVALKIAGLKSLGELTQKRSINVFAKLHITPLRYNVLIDYIACLIEFCNIGLIENGPQNHNLLFRPKNIAKDTSKRRGVQPLSPDQVSSVISTSLFYIQNGHELCDILALFKTTPSREKNNFVQRAALKYPVLYFVRRANFEKKVSVLLQVSAFHLIGFHLGMRISEFLSQKVGCLGVHQGANVMFCDRVTLQMTTIKAAETLYGQARHFPVHPYLQHVYSVLLRLRTLFDVPSELIFTTLRTHKMWNTNNFNRQLKIFSEDHGLDNDLSTHVWRKTIVATTTLSVSNSLEALRELLGHAGVTEAASYAMSSPFVKAEMDRENRKLVTAYLDDMVGDCMALGGKGLGGPQGNQLERTLVERGVHRLGKRKKRVEHDRIVRQSVALNMAKVIVDDGIECFKQTDRRGACAQNSGDSLPDIAGCRPDCRYRIERSQRRTFLQQRIRTVHEWLLNTSIPMMDRVCQARDLLDNMVGWPDLRPEFDSMLISNPDLKRFFGQ